MILKGSQRSGAKQLSNHLLRTDENEHVEIHDIRGFSSDAVDEALFEAYAMSRGTRCKQYMFSLSLNPPQNENVPPETFDKALREIENKLGLNDQPRIIVFHEKEGRRHAHCVWSRIDTDSMTAINLPYYKTRLREVSKQIYLEQGWDIPKGLLDSQYKNPLNFTLTEWQQSKRTGKDPIIVKAVMQECWKLSDNKASFSAALEDQGYYLAKGDKRSYVAIDWQGEVYSLTRTLNAKKKELTAKLGGYETLPSIAETKSKISRLLTASIRSHIDQLAKKHAQDIAPHYRERSLLVQQHRIERQTQKEIQKQRFESESRQRARRLRKGLKGAWDFLTGRYHKTKKQNEAEALSCQKRDNSQKDKLRRKQMEDRRKLQLKIKSRRDKQQKELLEFQSAVSAYIQDNATHNFTYQYKSTLKKEKQLSLKNDFDEGFEQ